MPQSRLPILLGRRHRAIAALVVLTVLWGSTFTVTELLCKRLDVHRAAHLPESLWRMHADGHPQFAPHADTTPLIYSALRFGLVTLLLGWFLRQRIRRLLNRRALGYGLVLGAVAGIGMILQTYGLQRTSPSVSAFLTALNVPFTALLIWIFWRTRPSLPLALGIGMAFVGVGVISLGPAEAGAVVRNELPLLGEMMTVACALLFAWHTILIDRYTKREDAMVLTWGMFAAMAVVSLVPLPLFAGGEALIRPGFWHDVGSDALLLGNLAYIVLLPTLLGFSLMMLYQREIEPSQAAVVYALEPLHATGISVAFGRESLEWWKVVGGALIVGGNLVAEILHPEARHARRQRRQQRQQRRHPSACAPHV